MANKNQNEKVGKEIGVSGTVISNGIISMEEYNSDLDGDDGIEIFDQMRRSDGTVRAALQAIELPIKEVEWGVEAADSKNAKAKELAEFVEDNLFNQPVQSWRYTLHHFLLGLVYGRMVFEIVRKWLPDGKIGIHKFGPRLPKTVDAWEMEGGGEGITQSDPNSGKTISIPIDKLIVATNEMEGDNWDGISILRAAYKHWYIKDKLYTIDAMSHERHGLGIPIGRLPETASQSDEQEMIECLKNIRANEESYVKMKGEWTIEMLGMSNTERSDPFNSIQHHDRKILMSMLAQFLDLGEGKVGSFALSRDQSEFFILSLEAIADDIIAEPINKYLVPKLIEWNFLDVPKELYPKVVHGQIGRKDYNTFSVALQRLAQAKLITTNVATEEKVRNDFDLNPLSDEEIKVRTAEENTDLKQRAESLKEGEVKTQEPTGQAPQEKDGEDKGEEQEETQDGKVDEQADDNKDKADEKVEAMIDSKGKDFFAKFSPACRKANEKKSECVSRKVPELIKEGYDRDQAVAIANSLCSKACKVEASAKHSHVSCGQPPVKMSQDTEKRLKDLIIKGSNAIDKLTKVD